MNEQEEALLQLFDSLDLAAQLDALEAARTIKTAVAFRSGARIGHRVFILRTPCRRAARWLWRR